MHRQIQLFGQIIHNEKLDKAWGVELLGRPRNIVNIEEYFASLDNTRSANWTEHQLTSAISLVLEYGIFVTVNLDLHTIDLIDLSQYNYTGIVFEFTYTTGLPPVEVLERIRKQCPNVLIVLDDYKMEPQLLRDQYLTFFDLVKLDITVLSGLKRYGDRMNIIKSFVSLLRSHNIVVIAEGIENDEDLMLIKQCGIAIMQGYKFSKPSPIDDIIAHLPKKG